MAARTDGRTMTQLAGRIEVPAPEAPSGRAKAGYFVRHALEMCASMCLGMVALDPVYFWIAGLFGYANPLLQLPELSALVVAFNMTAPMVAWMRFRGMRWSPIAEMSAAMGIEAILIMGAYWLGLLTNSPAGGATTLFHLQHGLMMPAMLIPMFLRLDVYTGKKCH